MAKRVMERNWEELTITILGKEYDFNTIPQDMKDKCAFLGFGTKLVDNLAGMKAYSSEEKTGKVDKVFNSLLEGNWRVPGEGGSSSAKKEREKIMEAYKNADAENRIALAKCLAGQGYDFSGIE